VVDPCIDVVNQQQCGPTVLAKNVDMPQIATAAQPFMGVGMRLRSWLPVAVLVSLALLLRVGFLASLQQQGFVWADVDGYLAKGAALVASGGFKWTFDAVAYPWGGRVYALPPLFSLYLAPFARFQSYPVNAFVGLAILNALTILPIVWIGTRVHSRRAGLIGAFFYACWGSDIVAFGVVRQEPLYVPLVIAAFAALLRAWDGAGGRYAFVVAGAAFGLAALCRSMPIYFVAAMAVALAVRDYRGAGAKKALGLVAGFALLTVPYSIALSVHLGQPTLIENHGGILVAHRLLPYNDRVLSFTTVATTLVTRATREPVSFVAEIFDLAQSLLHVAGGRFIQEAVQCASASTARMAQAAVHLLIDVPWLVALGLTPLGLVLARNRPAGAILFGWALLNVSLTALTGFGGSRLRVPFEAHLVILASVVLAGGWVKPRIVPLALGIISTIVLVVVMLPQVERSFGARAGYGPRWGSPATGYQVAVTGASGANVLVSSGAFDVAFDNPGLQAVRVDLTVDGASVMRAAVIGPGERRSIPVVYGRQALAFVEVEAVGADGAPSTVNVHVERR
jgi:hypothetical protein